MCNDKLRVALVQLDLVDSSINLNMDKIRKTVLPLGKNKPDIIVIPELAIEGYNFNYVKQMSETDFNHIIMFYSDLAKEIGTMIVTGFVEKKHDRYYDAALCVDKTGKIIDIYRKFHLWGKESDFFTPGNQYSLLEVNGWKIGIGICADAGFPEFSRSLALLGADILVYISAWVKPYTDSWLLMCQARACENQMYVIGVNRIGFASGAECCGNSVAIDPAGCIISNLSEREDFSLIDLELSKVRQKRQEIPWLKMRKPSLYRL